MKLPTVRKVKTLYILDAIFYILGIAGFVLIASHLIIFGSIAIIISLLLFLFLSDYEEVNP
ncbi:MAG: hypothetical protein JEZ05_08225 [Tenericutes bacterium]|nr:hypothetical protein [Mycoplasmatota bacterium]